MVMISLHRSQGNYFAPHITWQLFLPADRMVITAYISYITLIQELPDHLSPSVLTGDPHPWVGGTTGTILPHWGPGPTSIWTGPHRGSCWTLFRPETQAYIAVGSTSVPRDLATSASDSPSSVSSCRQDTAGIVCGNSRILQSRVIARRQDAAECRLCREDICQRTTQYCCLIAGRIPQSGITVG